MTDVRGQLRQAAYHALHRSGAAQWYRRSGGVVFCYHNVVPDDIAGLVGIPSLHIAVSEFADQIGWIANEFTVVPITEMLSRLRHGRSVAGLAALTFDDGYAGVVRHAIPVMRKAHVPFTLFPVVQAADERQPFWWDLAGALQNETRERYINALKGDRDAVCREYPDAVDLPDDALPASWEMYRAILDDDCSIGVHGVTHRNLTTLPAEEVVWELTHARTRVGEELAVPTDVIAYPYGRTNASVQAVAERLGFQAGLTNDSSLIREGHALFDVGRINVPGGLSIATFACWASGLKLRV